MGRRRVKEKHIPMSLSIPYALIQRVDSELSFKQSRSKWVQGAIEAKLEDSKAFDLSNKTSISLAWELRMRNVISPGMFETLEKVIKAMTLVVETEE